MAQMVVLVDNDVPEAVAVFLEGRGHEVYRVRDVLDPAAADPDVAAWAHIYHAVVVTFNHRHYKLLISRRPHNGHERYRHAGRISLTCRQRSGHQRIEQLVELIEFEYARAQRLGDRRLIVEVCDGCAVVER